MSLPDGTPRWDVYLDLFNRGYNQAEIASAFGISRQAVNAMFIRHGMRTRKPRALDCCYLCGQPYTDWDQHYRSWNHGMAEVEFAEGMRKVVSNVHRETAGADAGLDLRNDDNAQG